MAVAVLKGFTSRTPNDVSFSAFGICIESIFEDYEARPKFYRFFAVKLESGLTGKLGYGGIDAASSKAGVCIV